MLFSSLNFLVCLLTQFHVIHPKELPPELIPSACHEKRLEKAFVKLKVSSRQKLKNNRGNCTVNVNTDKQSLITPEYNKYGVQIAYKEKYSHSKSQNWTFRHHRFSCHHQQCKQSSTFLSVLYCFAYIADDEG